MPATVDTTAESQKPASRARAHAREHEAHAVSDPDSSTRIVSPTDFEAVARAIETGTPAPRETIATIINSEPNIRRIVVAAAVRALGATKWYYDSEQKRRIVEPDYALTFRACEFLADRADGKPAQSLLTFNMHQDAGTKPKRDPADAANWSPAMVAAMERKIVLAKTAEAKRASSLSQPALDVSAREEPAG